MFFTVTAILTNFHNLIIIYSTKYITKQKMRRGRTRKKNKNHKKDDNNNLSVLMNIQPLKPSIPKIPSKLKTVTSNPSDI